MSHVPSPNSASHHLTDLSHPGTRERHLESVLQAALRQLVCVKAFPRSVFQITLQLSHTPTNDYASNKLVQAQMVRSHQNMYPSPRKRGR